MKIAYVTSYDAKDVRNWSGLGYFIGKMLEESGHEVDYIGNLNFKNKYFFKSKKLLHKFVGKNYLWERQYSIAKHFAKQISRRISPETDIIFCPGTLPIAFLNSDKPKVCYTDALFAGMIDYYPSFCNLTTKVIKTGNEIEQMALGNCDLALFSSTWAAETALKYYKVEKQKIQIVPFGANITAQRHRNLIEQLIRSRHKSKCILLFMGVDWERKGGDKAVKVAQTLNQIGIETELRLLGVKNLEGKKFPPFVVDYGFISKSSDEGKALIENIMQQSHFLILPTIADCTPVVFSEACSFGLPVLTTNTGGITSIIENHVNGFMFDIQADASEYAQFVVQILSNEYTYRALCLSSFDTYVQRLNWHSAGKSITNHLHKLVR
jgi:glycosyltransferase involved in cell wall biosynthesis